ncbi:hypothetical protein JCM12294_22930 [Desulfocicer niacini]
MIKAKDLNDKRFYDFSAVSLQGKTVSTDVYRGKAVLVVNTTRNCGLHPPVQGAGITLPEI